MLASALALAAIVVSDIAEARARGVDDADDVTVAPPVVMKKVQVKVEAPADDLADVLDVLDQPRPRKPSRKGLSFGRFEGY